MKKVINPEKVVLPIHFEDRSGVEFERLCFAYIYNVKDWITIDWYGQLGSDRGRDIWGVVRNDYGRDETYCYQCANHRSLKFNKAKKDIDKIVAGQNKIPNNFILILGGKVSADMKSKVIEYAKSKKIAFADVWTGAEFEEKLRKDTPFLIRRFCEGVTFPESSTDLKSFSIKPSLISDAEILSLMAQCFDRPAFRTPFKEESSIPAFKQAITDTIEVLNTGIHRLRDGTEIKRIPSRHDIQNEETKQTLSSISTKLIALRSTFDNFLLTGEIKHCGCNNPNCPVYMSSPKASRIMDKTRKEILESFRIVYPDLDRQIGELLTDVTQKEMSVNA